MTSYTYSSRRRRLPDEEIVRLYVEGLDSDTVGARANCSYTVVLNLVRAAGHQVRKPGGIAHNIAMPDEEICRRYRAGESGPVIARAAGCTASSIYRVLKRHGIPRRLDQASAATVAAAAARRQARNP